METQYPGVTLGAIGRKQGLVLIDAPFRPDDGKSEAGSAGHRPVHLAGRLQRARHGRAALHDRERRACRVASGAAEHGRDLPWRNTMMSDDDSSRGPTSGTDRLIEMLAKDASAWHRFGTVLFKNQPPAVAPRYNDAFGHCGGHRP